MSLKKSAGNMYPWVTHTHSHLAGRCPHECAYCYVQAMERRFKSGRYTGPLRLDERELAVNYGKGRTIFVEHCNDLFAEAVPDEWIGQILAHCRRFPENIYVFQTKNPGRVGAWLREEEAQFPPAWVLGTTIETNRAISGTAPAPAARARAMTDIRKAWPEAVLFVTVEPIHDLDVAELLSDLFAIGPDFVNVGADSKGHGLVEPSAEKVRELIAGIQELGIELRQKRNLDRLLSREAGQRVA